MTKETIGNRPVDITKENNDIKIIFHPIAKTALHPDANVFTIKISKKDLDILKKSF